MKETIVNLLFVAFAKRNQKRLLLSRFFLFTLRLDRPGEGSFLLRSRLGDLLVGVRTPERRVHRRRHGVGGEAVADVVRVGVGDRGGSSRFLQLNDGIRAESEVAGAGVRVGPVVAAAVLVAGVGVRERGVGCSGLDLSLTFGSNQRGLGGPHRFRGDGTTGVDPPGFAHHESAEGDAEEDPPGEAGAELHRVRRPVRPGNGDGGGGPLAVAFARLGAFAGLASRVGDEGENCTSLNFIAGAGTSSGLHLLRPAIAVVVGDLDL